MIEEMLTIITISLICVVAVMLVLVQFKPTNTMYMNDVCQGKGYAKLSSDENMIFHCTSDDKNLNWFGVKMN